MSGFDLAIHARDLALLEIDTDQPVTEERVKSARRAAAAKHHPDAGGSAERMVEINNAHDALVAALRRVRERAAQ
jgi:DnaJ-class molecular chaperone